MFDRRADAFEQNNLADEPSHAPALAELTETLRGFWTERSRPQIGRAMPVDPESVLFLTLDSCRFDTFDSAFVPNMREIGRLHKAQAPSYFTFGSHAAMFAGFTPGVAASAAPLFNPKVAKMFKVGGAASAGKGGEGFILDGENIVEGFKIRGYTTLGSGAVTWFDPETSAARMLVRQFDEFFYPGDTWSLGRQLAWIDDRLNRYVPSPIFLFLNIGETHVPYYFEGARWNVDDSPCIPFQTVDRSAECRRRQSACLEFVDRMIGELLGRFSRRRPRHHLRRSRRLLGRGWSLGTRRQSSDDVDSAVDTSASRS